MVHERSLRSGTALVVLASMFVVLVAGLLSRSVFRGVPILGAELGDALYAVELYLVVRLGGLWALARGHISVGPGRAAVGPVAGLSAVLCAAVEFFQLTGVPERLAAEPAVGRSALILGQGFRWWDLVALTIGVAGAASLDWWLSGR